MILKSSHLKIFKILLFLVVLYFTFILRAHNYDRTPGVGHLEELLYGWSGIYLVETGVPVSWSTLDYPESSEVFKGQKTINGGEPKAWVTLYKPWLDEPPLFSLLVGYYGHINGANREDIIPSAYLRFPVIFISTLTSVFIFLVARLIYGYSVGLLSMLVYGITPIIVFASRLAVPENVIALIFMVMLYLLFKFQQSGRFIYILLIPFLVGIAGLSKPTGYFLLPLAVCFVFLKQLNDKRGKKALLFNFLYLVVLTLPFIGAFIWYGQYFDKDIFWRIVEIQGFRPVGFSSLAFILTTPAYDIFELTDSWYLFCLLASVFFIFHPKKEVLEKLLIFSFVYYLILILISGGEADLLPWYRFPIFPLISIFGSLGLIQVIKKADFFASFLTVGLLLGGRYLVVNAFRPNIQSMEYRLIFTFLMLPSTLNFIFNKKLLESISKIIIIGVIIFGAYYNVIYIYNRYELSCESQDCPIGPDTWLSSIHIPFVWRFMVLGEPTYR